MQVFNGLALNPLDRINMPNKQSSTKRFRTDTAIKLNHSTSYLRKRGKKLPVILLLTHWSLFGFSLGGSLNLSFSKEVCVAGYTAIGITEFFLIKFLLLYQLFFGMSNSATWYTKYLVGQFSISKKSV